MTICGFCYLNLGCLPDQEACLTSKPLLHMFFFFFKHWTHLMLMACTWVKSHSPEHGYRPGTASLKKTDDCPLPAAMTEIVPWLCVGVLWISPFIWKFWVVWSYVGLVHAGSTAASSCVQRPYHIQNIVIHSSPRQPLTLQSLTSSSSLMIFVKEKVSH